MDPHSHVAHGLSQLHLIDLFNISVCPPGFIQFFLLISILCKLLCCLYPKHSFIYESKIRISSNWDFQPSLFSLLSAAGQCRVSSDTARPVRSLVSFWVLWVCVGAGGSVSAQRHLRRLPDEHADLAAHGAVWLLCASLQTHLHARR